MQQRTDSDLVDWLLRTYPTHREGRANQPSWPDLEGGAPEPFLDSRPWRGIQPPPGRLQAMPFYVDQLETLLKIPPKDLESRTRSEWPKERAIQPPIFFPFD